MVSIDNYHQTCLKMQMFVMSKHLQMSTRFEDILSGIISNIDDEDKLDFSDQFLLLLTFEHE